MAETPPVSGASRFTSEYIFIFLWILSAAAPPIGPAPALPGLQPALRSAHEGPSPPEESAIKDTQMLTTDPEGVTRFRARRRRIAEGDPEPLLGDLRHLSTEVRRSIVQMIDRAQLGHIGGDLSVTDILVTLFGGIL